MALKYKVLEKFSREAREYAAARVYDQERNGVNLCADGRCVLGNLLLMDGIDHPSTGGTPTADYVATALGYSLTGRYAKEARRIMALNDTGELATPEAVRSLLLGDESH